MSGNPWRYQRPSSRYRYEPTETPLDERFAVLCIHCGEPTPGVTKILDDRGEVMKVTIKVSVECRDCQITRRAA